MTRNWIVFAAALSLSAPAMALADGVDCNWPELVKETKANHAAAKKAEASGNLFEAYLYYGNSLGCLPDADRERQRVGKLLGQAAEKAGRKYGSAPLTVTVPDPVCKKYHDAMSNAGEGSEIPKEPLPSGSCVSGQRLKAGPQATAFGWYEDSRNYADSDRLMGELWRANPADPGAFGEAFRHFSNRRDFNGTDDTYRTDPKYEAELKANASVQAAAVFATEEKEWNLKEVNIAGDPSQRSLATLQRSRSWAEFYSDPLLKKIAERAVLRGDDLAKNGSSPQTLQSAIAFYRFAPAEQKVPAVQKTAEKKGDEAAAAGKTMDAAGWYGVSGNEAKMKAMTKQFEKEAQKMAEGAKKSVESLKKSDADRSKFRKEQDDLEKELGF